MTRWIDGGPDRTPASGRHPRRRALLAAATAALLAVVIAVLVRPAEESAEATPRTTAPATTSTRGATVPESSGASPTAIPEQITADPAALRELDAVAATLTTPIVLSSPAEWDRWLPAGKPYPGVDSTDDMATCPRLTDRLEAALGVEMSYWKGTLPQGPSGCTWATVPLSYGPDPYDHPYLAGVGFLADGTTTEQMSRSFFHHQGRICPSIPLPSAGEGAHLIRCEELEGGLSYVLALRDARTTGVWVLVATAREDAGHPATDLLPPVVDGVRSTFG